MSHSRCSTMKPGAFLGWTDMNGDRAGSLTECWGLIVTQHLLHLLGPKIKDGGGICS